MDIDRSKTTVATADLLKWLEGFATTKPENAASAAPVECVKNPGKLPNASVGKLAIKAAWQIECTTKRAATAQQVMTQLQEWADSGEEPDVLLKSNKATRGVMWRTKKGKEKLYDTDACGKALAAWKKSRA